MALSLHFVLSSVWYAPDILNNRESDHPFEVLLTPLTGAEHEALTLAGAFGTPDTLSSSMIALRDEWIPKKVTAVRNLELLDENGASYTPVDGADLLQYAKKCDRDTMDTLLWSIFTALISRSALEAGLAKKSLNASEPPDTPPSGRGVVPSVDATSTVKRPKKPGASGGTVGQR